MSLPDSIRKEYPFRGHHFTLKNGFKIHYLDEGSPENLPIIFLHGNPTWSFFYRNLVSSLKDQYRCIAPDHLGCGLSEKPSSRKFAYNLEGHSNNLLELLDALEIKKFNLIVHDWGGAIGLSALRDDFSRINKLVLLNTASFLSNDVPKRIQLCRIPLIGEFFVRMFNGFAWPASWMATTKGLPASVKKGFLYPYNNWNNRVAIWNFVKDIPLENHHPTKQFLQDTENALTNLSDTPILACWGMQDFCFHSGFLKEWQKRLPHLETLTCESAGHYLLEDSFDLFHERIKSFLS
jgi:haloalkane dehalogenase